MKSKSERLEATILMKITETDKAILQMLAKSKRISLSAYIRMIVLEKIEIKTVIENV